MKLIEHSDSPRYVRLHPADNVVVVVNDQGVAEGSVFPDGLTTVEGVPQSHKVALVNIPKGARSAAMARSLATRSKTCARAAG